MKASSTPLTFVHRHLVQHRVWPCEVHVLEQAGAQHGPVGNGALVSMKVTHDIHKYALAWRHIPCSTTTQSMARERAGGHNITTTELI